MPHRPVPQGRKRRGVVAADSSVMIPAMPIPGESCLESGVSVAKRGFCCQLLLHTPWAADSLGFIPQVLTRF